MIRDEPPARPAVNFRSKEPETSALLLVTPGSFFEGKLSGLSLVFYQRGEEKSHHQLCP